MIKSKDSLTLGIVGVRGYVGRELIRLLAGHPYIKVQWVSSRQLKGITLNEFLSDDAYFNKEILEPEHYYNNLKIETLSEIEVASRNTDIIVLALPNGLAAPFVTEIEKQLNSKMIIDLSADYRFDESWQYSIPELNSIFSSNKKNDSGLMKTETGLKKISNPGCYATAMQIALAPLAKHIKGVANCFGVSGFSGAGKKPSANNNPDNLKDNILPYGLIEHLHEKEVSFHLDMSIHFSPHVAQFFRGISMTVQAELKECWTIDSINDLFVNFYDEQLVVKINKAIPNIQQVTNSNNCHVGGFSLSENGKRLTLVSCLDNLLKGAATQAIQNIELFYDTK